MNLSLWQDGREGCAAEWPDGDERGHRALFAKGEGVNLAQCPYDRTSAADAHFPGGSAARVLLDGVAHVSGVFLSTGLRSILRETKDGCLQHRSHAVYRDPAVSDQQGLLLSLLCVYEAVYDAAGVVHDAVVDGDDGACEWG